MATRPPDDSGQAVRHPARLGLGLAALGRPGYINLGHAGDLAGEYRPAQMRRRAFAVLDAAYAAGLRHFDVARSYGLAETFLADWLRARRLPPGSQSVSSKWGYTYTAAWQVSAPQHEVKDHSAGNFGAQWPQSRALLGPWLKVYAAHSVTPDSPLLADAALLERLARLREEGITPGLSVSGPQQAGVIERALALRAAGQPVFGAVQASWNLLEPSAGAALRAAKAAGWTVYVKEALANGRLTARSREGLPEPLRALSIHRNISPDALALAAVLAQPFADVVLSGAVSVDQLHSNLAAQELEFAAGELEALVSRPETPDAYWRTRAGLSWN